MSTILAWWDKLPCPWQAMQRIFTLSFFFFFSSEHDSQARTFGVFDYVPQ